MIMTWVGFYLIYTTQNFCYVVGTRGGKIGPVRWASPVRPKLGPGWAIKFLARKKSGQIWPGPTDFFFALKRLFGPIGPIFRTGWTVKILA